MPPLEETLLQALLEERRLSEERAVVPGLMQHDLANVLTQVSLASEFLAHAPGGVEREAAARDVLGGVKRMMELLEGMKLLYHTRIGVVDYARGDLAEFIARLAGEPGVWPKGAPITLALPATMWCSFSPTLLRHALVNLIGNAVAYSLGTWVRVRLSAVRGERWQIAIANGGPGIPTGHLPYLFSMGRQTGSSVKSDRPGLGLYIARTCVRTHGSVLRVRTRPKLTVFSFVVQGAQRGVPLPVPPGYVSG
ncbi:MAG: HAMP domain-containing histidine kinase [Undibacterium sp.]|nr:HAMP domain-containing histidine kinase [Opitutaceae bacterium]